MPLSRRCWGFGFALSLVLGSGALAGCAPPGFGEDLASTESGSSARTARERLEAAIEQKEKADAHVGLAMSHVGPMLTDVELVKLSRMLRELPDVAPVYADYHAGAAELERQLRSLLDDDDALARVMTAGPRTRWPEMTGDMLYDGFKLLANSPRAIESVRFATLLLNEDPRLARLSRSQQQVVEDLLVPAMPSAYVEYLVATGSTDEAALKLAELLDRAASQTGAVSKWLKLGAKTDIEGLQIAGQRVNPALKSISTLSSLWTLGVNVAMGDVDALAKQIASEGPAAVAAFAHGLAVMRRSLLGVEASPLLTQVRNVASRIGGVISIASSVGVLLNDLGAWKGSTSAKVRVAADLAGLASGVLALLAPTGIGAPIAAVGALSLFFLADVLAGQEAAAALERAKTDLRALLPRVGIAPSLVERLVEADPALVGAVSHTLGVAPRELQWLAEAAPSALVWSALSGPHPGYDGVIWLRDLFELSSDEVAGLFRAVVGDETDARKRDRLFDDFLRVTATIRFEMTPAQALAALGQASAPVAGDDAFDVARKEAVGNAHRFLTAH